jgi:hypothetical protein
MYNRLTLRLPERCKFCASSGSVKPEQTIKGTSVLLKWACDGCGRDWPIALDEESVGERRRGLPERRRVSRNDRRKVS